jgi:GNAT superfamily N-acetyltransferase
MTVLLRPVKISDEPLLKEFFYSLSGNTLYRRFMSMRKDMPHERLQEFVVVDYTRQMSILAVLPEGNKETVIGLGQYIIDEDSYTAEVAFVVRDEYQGRGVGGELLSYLIYLAKRNGLLSLSAEVLPDNLVMLHLLEKAGFRTERRDGGVVYLRLKFSD